MMKIQRFECNMLAENCYILSDDSAECVIIDCGTYFTEERKALSDYIRNNHLKPVHLLCTHGHLDHVFGNEWIHAEFDLLPEIGRDDDYLITDLRKQARDIFGTEFPLQQLPIGRWLSDGDTITFGEHQLKAIATPGHTPGGMVFYCEEEKVAFTGDTLFQMSIGRTDFEGGDDAAMRHTLKEVIGKLPADTTIWSGHGPNTTIADELRMNPYLR